MLTKEIIAGDIDKYIEEILVDFHIEGPVSGSHLETLSYAKEFYPNKFINYERKLMFLMGLFYKTSNPESLIEMFYSMHAESIQQQTGYSFTPIQADVYNSIDKYANFSFSAPTSAGKSYLFQEVIKEINGDIIIVVPSRALLSEYLIKIKRIVGKETLVLPFIEIVNTKKSKKRVYVITPERGEDIFSNIDHLNLQLIFFDEAQISEEGIRGMKFDSLVRRIDRKISNVKKVFAHPFILNPEAQFQKHNIQRSIDFEVYNQKTVGKIYLEYSKNEFTYFSPFSSETYRIKYEGDIISNLLSNDRTALIFISKSSIYKGAFLETYAKYIEQCSLIKNPKALKYIEEMQEFLGTTENDEKHSQIIYLMKRGIVIHHGSMPLKARLIIEEFVNMKFAKLCFSTSTLIQGINMPFDLVWISNFKFTGNEDKKKLDLKNLIGRAGRTTNEENAFDYGYVVIDKKNIGLFRERLNSESLLSSHSTLDDPLSEVDEDHKDLVEAIKNDTFNNKLQLTDRQIARIDRANIDKDIEFVINNILDDSATPITATKYYNLSSSSRKKIKIAIENIYTAHLRRKELTIGEKSVLSTAIPILLWIIQGKSFSEIISLRYAFLSEKTFRRQLRRELFSGKITLKKYTAELQAKKIRFSCIAEMLPNKTFLRGAPLFPNTSIIDIDFDTLVYDTYDYIDKVISLSLKDPISTAFLLYYTKTNNVKALALSNYIKYGTDNDIEIWLLKYGFTFDEIEWILPYVLRVNAEKIVFSRRIERLSKEQRAVIERFI